MAFFDKLSNSISAAGKDGLNKAKEWKDTAKLTRDIRERESYIQKMYRDLGKKYYQDHREDPEPDYEQVAAIRAAFEEIGELKEAKDEIKGIRRCSVCGNPIPPEAKFCPSCGEKCEAEPETVEFEVVDDIPEEFVEEPAAEVVAEEASEEPADEAEDDAFAEAELKEPEEGPATAD